MPQAGILDLEFDVATGLALANGPIVSALLEHNFSIVPLVQPALLAFTPSRAKDDLRSVLRRYTEQYFDTARPRQGIGQRILSGRRVALSDTAGKIVAFPVLNGLHSDYRMGCVTD